MARVTKLDPASLDPETASVFQEYTTEYGPFRDQAAVLAHVPTAMRHLPQMLMDLRASANIDQRYIELTVVTVSKLNACPYCVGQHGAFLSVEGVDATAIDSLPDANHPAFDETDRLVIEFARLVTERAGQMPQSIFDRLGRIFTEAQIVELTLRASLCGFFNRFNDALQIAPEFDDPSTDTDQSSSPTEEL